jgi:ABC-2 type transport system permease protein
VAFVIGLVVCGLLVFLGQFVGRLQGGPLYEAIDALAITSHFQAIGRGVLDLRDLVYFASIIGFFLYLNVQAVHNRRYR